MSFCFYFELSSGFIDGYTFDNMSDCINTWCECSEDKSVKKVGKIFVCEDEDEDEE